MLLSPSPCTVGLYLQIQQYIINRNREIDDHCIQKNIGNLCSSLQHLSSISIRRKDAQDRNAANTLCQNDSLVTWCCYIVTEWVLLSNNPSSYWHIHGKTRDMTHTAPGIRPWRHMAWYRHMMGIWLPSPYPQPGSARVKRRGTGWHRDLATAILAQGAYSILSHAIVAFRRAIFWQDTWVLLLLLFQAVPGSLNCKWARNWVGCLLAMCCHDF